MALIDLLCVTIGFLGTSLLARWLGLPVPGTAALLASLIVATWRLWLNGESWVWLGLRFPEHWPKALAWTCTAFVSGAVLNVLLVAPLANVLKLPPQDLSRFAGLAGNAMLLAGFLTLAWTTAALGEELLFRGFVLSRIEAAIAGSGQASGIALVAAIVLQAALFGIAHAYLGIRGAIAAAVVGLVYGTVYHASGKQLVPLILAHGITDTISLAAIYAGAAQVVRT